MGRKNDNAVSPVIGTILLVALTVVFVAGVAVVATGLAGGMFAAKEVGVTLSPYAVSDGNTEHGVSVTVHGGKDAGDLVSLSASIGTPALYYQKTGTTAVPDPAIGVGYRFFVDTGTAAKTYGNTQVQTNEVTNLGALADRYVTVTGTFRDGSEQVLLVQKVTIPAVSDGVIQQYNYTYVRVLTFVNTSGTPGHGLMVSLINSSAKSVTSIKLDVKNPDGKPLPNASATLTKPHSSGDGSFFFYLDAGKTVNDNPYYEFTESDADPTEQLIGTATISVNLLDKTTVSEIVPVNIPARINIFENNSIASGTLTPTTVPNKIANLTFSQLPSNAKRIAYGLRDNQIQLGYIDKDLSGDSYALGNKDNGTITYLQQSPNDTLEAYVLVSEGSTSVWYRVASVPVSDLLQKT